MAHVVARCRKSVCRSSSKGMGWGTMGNCQFSFYNSFICEWGQTRQQAAPGIKEGYGTVLLLVMADPFRPSREMGGLKGGQEGSSGSGLRCVSRAKSDNYGLPGSLFDQLAILGGGGWLGGLMVYRVFCLDFLQYVNFLFGFPCLVLSWFCFFLCWLWFVCVFVVH